MQSKNECYFKFLRCSKNITEKRFYSISLHLPPASDFPSELTEGDNLPLLIQSTLTPGPTHLPTDHHFFPPILGHTFCFHIQASFLSSILLRLMALPVTQTRYWDSKSSKFYLHICTNVFERTTDSYQ